MASVKDLLDRLAAGDATLDETVSAFRNREWPVAGKASEAANWGAEDPPFGGPDSFDVVAADSRLTTAQYQALARAYEETFSRQRAAAAA